jgi:hypothetical protein
VEVELPPMIVALLLLAIGIFTLPTAGTFLVERGRRAAWGIVSEGWEPAGSGAYREVRVARQTTGRAPASVVVAAWSSFFLGQWIVPGALAVLLMILVMAEIPWAGNLTLLVSALGAPSGLALGGRLLGVGVALLARDFGVERTARRTARWAFAHNGILVGAMVAAAAIDRRDESIALATGTAIWALVSIAHAGLLLVAARAVERHAAREWQPESAPVAS